MTPNETVELLFRARAEGGAEIDRFAASTRNVSAAATAANTDIGSLERALIALKTTVDANTAALQGGGTAASTYAAGLRQVGEAGHASVSGMQAASAAIRGLEGSMNVRAAERFIGMFSGLSQALTVAFPIFGLLAVGHVLDSIVEKTEKWANAHDPVLQAQKESLSLLEKEGKEYDKLSEKLRKLKLDEYERKNGTEARQRLESREFGRTGRQDDADDIKRLEDLYNSLDRISQTKKLGGGNESTLGQHPLYEKDANLAARLRVALGLKDTDKTGLEGLRPGDVPSVSQAHAAQELQVGLDQALSTARRRQEVDVAHESDLNAKADAGDKRKADEAAKKRREELDQAERQAASYLRQAQTFELTGLERINEVYREKLALLGKTPKAIADITAAHEIEVQRETAKQVQEGSQYLNKLNDRWMSEVGSGNAEYDPSTGGYKQVIKPPKKLQLTGYSAYQEEQDDKFVNAALKLYAGQDDADADGVRRGAATAVKKNSLAVGSGRMSGQQGADNSYSARLSAAEEIFRIETQHLDLYYKEGQAAEKLASARKKYADDVYRAEEEHETALAQLRERDLQKYQGMAGSLFDAISNKSTSQWLKDLGTSQVRQMFVNTATGPLQQAGHALAGIMPASMGGLLHGTMLDPANAGISDSQTTAKQTTRTADEVAKLRADMRAINGGPGAPGAASDLANLPLSGGKGWSSDIWKFGSDIGGGWGTSTKGPGSAGLSQLFQAGDKGTASQFLSGITGGGENPLGAIFGGSSTSNGVSTQLTGAQRAGAAVGAAAMVAGAGLAVVQGLKRGGVSGISSAVGAGAGAAAMLDPEPISKAVLGTIAAASSIVGAIFGDSKTKRSKDQAEALANATFLAPTALNVTQSMDGHFVDFGSRGNLRGSSLSAVPTVAESYLTSQGGNYYTAPGAVTSPFSGSPRGTGQAPISNMTVIIQTQDMQSFRDFAQKHHAAIGEATATHLENHEGRLSNAIRFIAGS